MQPEVKPTQAPESTTLASVPAPTTPPPANGAPQELKSVAGGGAAPASSWQRVTRRSRAYGRVAGLLVALVILGGVGGYVISVGLRSPKSATKTTAPVVQTLSDDQIRKLSQTSNDLGTSNQVLTIGANSIFKGKVDVASDLTLGGHLNANGPVALSALSISGATTMNNLAVNQGLQVSGLTNAQNGLAVKGPSSVNGDLTVSGTTAVATLSANTISAKQLQLSGPLSITHLVSSGAPVTVSGTSSLGSGGTVSISGNDTAGTVTASLGNGGSAGTIATVTFRTAYAANVHVILSPVSGAAAQSQYYVSRTPTGFSISIANPVSGGGMTFDYLVVQ